MEAADEKYRKSLEDDICERLWDISSGLAWLTCGDHFLGAGGIELNSQESLDYFNMTHQDIARLTRLFENYDFDDERARAFRILISHSIISMREYLERYSYSIDHSAQFDSVNWDRAFQEAGSETE